MTGMPRDKQWIWIGGGLLLLLLAYWLDYQRPFPPLLQNSRIAARA
jgi:hypothetical protein